MANTSIYAAFERMWQHVIAALGSKADKTDIVQSDWDETNESSLAFIKNKPDENDALELLTEMNIIDPVVADDGSIYTDENGALWSL